MAKTRDTERTARRLIARLRCWWSGHDPDLQAPTIETFVIPTREFVTGPLRVTSVGRTLHFGKTKCLRCEKELELQP